MILYSCGRICVAEGWYRSNGGEKKECDWMRERIIQFKKHLRVSTNHDIQSATILTLYGHKLAHTKLQEEQNPPQHTHLHFLVEGVVPEVLHVVPVAHNAVLHLCCVVCNV